VGALFPATGRNRRCRVLPDAIVMLHGWPRGTALGAERRRDIRLERIARVRSASFSLAMHQGLCARTVT